MIHLILDTNIWIAFVARNNPSGILEMLEVKNRKGSIRILSNEIVVAEWIRNKKKTIADITGGIKNDFDAISRLSNYLPKDEGRRLRQAFKPFQKKKKELIGLGIQRVEDTEKLITSCEMTEVTDEMKLRVVEWGLNRKAPFHDKGSVADALILLSSAEYCMKHTRGIKDSIFVSFNHKDYTDGKNKDEIHTDLKDLVDGANMIYKRNIAEALHLAPKLQKEVEDLINFAIWHLTRRSMGKQKWNLWSNYRNGLSQKYSFLDSPYFWSKYLT
jgi:hypothetical protein